MKTPSTIICFLLLVALAGCAGKQLRIPYFHRGPAGANLAMPPLPEHIMRRAEVEKHTTAQIGVFRFADLGTNINVGYTAAGMLYQALLEHNTFSAISSEIDSQSSDPATQLDIAKQKGYDLMITGRVLQYMDGTLYQESRVDLEMKVYDVKTAEYIWYATATEVDKPIPYKDYYIFKKKGQEPVRPSILIKRNIAKFINLFTWETQHHEALTDDMKQVDIGYNHMIEKNYDKATYFFNEALRLNPNNPYAILNLGVIAEEQGKLINAAEMYAQVIELQPNQTVSQSNKSNAVGKTLTEIAKENLEALPAK
jgi:tetratricopeptide (TPR) repeat protein